MRPFEPLQSYTQAFNRQQRRSGTLGEGRAKHIRVDISPPRPITSDL
jgi:hypothetical protein